MTLAIAPPSEPSLEEYWPDIAELALQETVTDEAMPAGTLFDLAKRRCCCPTAQLRRRRVRYRSIFDTDSPAIRGERSMMAKLAGLSTPAKAKALLMVRVATSLVGYSSIPCPREVSRRAHRYRRRLRVRTGRLGIVSRLYVSALRATGYRNLEGTVELCHPLAVLVGENNAGKSNVIDGLRTVLEPEAGPRARRWLYGPHGVRVNAVAPGPIATQPVLEIAETLAPVLARIPSRRMSTPEEVAAAVVFLAGDDAANIHGAILSVDGGWAAV